MVIYSIKKNSTRVNFLVKHQSNKKRVMEVYHA